MDWLRTLLETSPMTTLFLVIAVGYVVGEINFKGFALGSGAEMADEFIGAKADAGSPDVHGLHDSTVKGLLPVVRGDCPIGAD